MVAKKTEQYRYALLSVVGAVALVALVALLKIYPVNFFSGDLLTGNVVQPTGAVVTYNGNDYSVYTAAQGDIVASGTADVTIAAISATRVILSADVNGGQRTRTLRLGDSAPFVGFTFSLYDIDDEVPELVNAPRAEACAPEYTGQTPICRGQSGCCGGTCRPLPVCGEEKDGPIDTCGDRQLYCCSGKLTFVPCADECKTDDDCPVLNCVQEPCPRNVCVAGQCVLEEPECSTDADCAIICVRAPCPQDVCIAGQCVPPKQETACDVNSDAFSCGQPFAADTVGFTLTGPVESIQEPGLRCMDGTDVPLLQTETSSGLLTLAASCKDTGQSQTYTASFTFQYQQVARPTGYAPDGCPVMACVPSSRGTCPLLNVPTPLCGDDKAARTIYTLDGCPSDYVCAKKQEAITCPAAACITEEIRGELTVTGDGA